MKSLLCIVLCSGLLLSAIAQNPPDLETQIRELSDQIKSSSSQAADGDKAALRNLNLSKVQLINLLDQDMRQLKKDVASAGLSSSAKSAIQRAIDADSAMKDSLNDSLGTREYGLTSATSKAEAKPATPVAALTAGAQGCSASALKGLGGKIILSNKIDPDGAFSGTSDAKDGSIRICVNDQPSAGLDSLSIKDGIFVSGTSQTIKGLKIGDKVAAQNVLPASTFGSLSNVVTVGACSSVGSGDIVNAPKLEAAKTDSTSVAGTLRGDKSDVVRICVDDREVAEADVAKSGKFIASLDFPLAQGQTITAQAVRPSNPIYGISSNAVQVGGDAAKSADNTRTILIGGIEQSGYSSLSQNTNAFLSAFIKGPPYKSSRWSGWGRVRLLSAPQPSTQGIISTFTDPTGKLSTVDFTKVGQALDFVIGPEYRLGPQSSRWSFVAGFGATTPLSSQDVTLTYVAPAPGTVECTTMVDRFSSSHGYTPGLTAAPTGSSTCLQGGYTHVAFSNQDRSNFLMKYGVGMRTTYPIPCKSSAESPCATSYTSLDISIGQDAALTRGLLRGFVLKFDGTLPIPTGNASWLYLFGSAYLRMKRNENNSPLILQTASGITIPSPTVIVLPLQQPNRDFYRLGVGLNLNQIFCKMSSSTCPDKSTGTESPQPSLDAGSPLSPATAKSGQDLDLTVKGKGFVESSKVQLNGKDLSNTVFKSATELTVAIPKAELKSPSMKVTVKTPAPGGGTTDAATLTVTP